MSVRRPSPTGDVVLCDVAREAANEVVERLQDHGVHHPGAIVIETIEVAVSDAAAEQRRRRPVRQATRWCGSSSKLGRAPKPR